MRLGPVAGGAMVAIVATLLTAPPALPAPDAGASVSAAQAKQRLRARTPAPGALLRVPGLPGRQHLWCRGRRFTDGPTVVVISGAGDFSLSWRRVQSALARHHTVCTYDRPSLGWSSPSPRPRTGRVIVRQLHRLLAAGAVRPPIVLMGHSMGGVYARMYAATYPAGIRGVVLVDPGDEHLDVAIPRGAALALARGVAQARRRQLDGARICASGRYARHLRLLPLDTSFPNRDARTDRRIQAAWCRTWRGTAAEGAGAATTWAQARRLHLDRGSLGHRPLAIVVSDADLTFVADPVRNAEIVRTWRRLQRDQVRLSSRSRFRVAHDSSHAVMLDRPDAVVAAARWVLRRVGP